MTEAVRRAFTVRYVRLLGILLVLQAVTGTAVKLIQGHADDLAHNGLHLLSGAAALWASSPRLPDAAARRFAACFGVLYLTLGALGPLPSLSGPPLQLEVADHVFHLIVGAVTLGVAARGSHPRSRGPACLTWSSLTPIGSCRPWWAWLLCSLIGTLLIALPDPDRRLFSISEDHGPGVLDLVGALVLTVGWAILDVQIWLGRRRLLALRRPHLLALVLIALAGAAITAFSVLRDAGIWWLSGAALLAGAQLVAAALAEVELEGDSLGEVERPQGPTDQPSPGVAPEPQWHGHPAPAGHEVR